MAKLWTTFIGNVHVNWSTKMIPTSGKTVVPTDFYSYKDHIRMLVQNDLIEEALSAHCRHPPDMTSSDFRTQRLLDLGLMNELLKSVFKNITCFTTFESLFLTLFSWILCRLDFFQKNLATLKTTFKKFCSEI